MFSTYSITLYSFNDFIFIQKVYIHLITLNMLNDFIPDSFMYIQWHDTYSINYICSNYSKMM